MELNQRLAQIREQARYAKAAICNNSRRVIKSDKNRLTIFGICTKIRVDEF